MPTLLAMAFVVAVASCAAFATAAGGDDAVSMLQSGILQEFEGQGPDAGRFAVGDHVLVNLEDSASAVKGSISAWNEAEGTYNVHLWVGHPRERERLHVPAASVTDARPQEKLEAEKVSRALLEEQVLAEERKAEDERRQFDEQLASEEAEVARKEAEEYAKTHADEMRMKEEKEALAKAREESKRRKRLENEKMARKEAEEEAKTHVKITVRGRHNKTAEFKLLRRTSFEEMMAEVCQKFGLEPSHTTFFYEKHEIRADDSARKLEMGATADVVVGMQRQQE